MATRKSLYVIDIMCDMQPVTVVGYYTSIRLAKAQLKEVVYSYIPYNYASDKDEITTTEVHPNVFYITIAGKTTAHKFRVGITETHISTGLNLLFSPKC